MPEGPETLPLLKLPAERPPFAGFLMRLLAFLIDCVLLWFIFKGLDRVARPGLLALNPALPWLAHLLVFIYFWISYGPLTKGQSVGKALLSLAVVGHDGQPIGWQAAARRALLHQGAFTLFFGMHMPSYLMLFPIEWGYGAFVLLTALSILGLTLLMMLAITILMHPFKRGWHDQWADSYVTGTPVPPAFRQTLDSPPDMLTERKMANHLKITLFLWLVAAFVLLLNPIRTLLGAAQRAEAEKMESIQRQYDTASYRLVSVILPSAERRKSNLRAIAGERERLRTQGQTVPTTETMRLQFDIFDDESNMAACFRLRGAYSNADLRDPAFKKSMEGLRRELWQTWLKSPEHASAGTTTDTLQARFFSVLLFEPLSLVMYNGRELRGRVRGPADPTQGGLTFEDVLPPAPQAADQTTTATASPEAVRPHATPRP